MPVATQTRVFNACMAVARLAESCEDHAVRHHLDALLDDLTAVYLELRAAVEGGGARPRTTTRDIPGTARTRGFALVPLAPAPRRRHVPPG